MKSILTLCLVFFAGLWVAYHFNFKRPVEKFDRVVSKVLEEVQSP